MSVLTPPRSAQSQPPSGRNARRTAGTRENFSAWANRHRKWLFAAPAMIFVGVLIIFPLAWTLYLSLTDSQGSVRAASEFVGLENYLTVLSDVERFWPAVGRTLSFTGVALVCEVVLGMCIALLLWRPFRGEKWVRVAILLRGIDALKTFDILYATKGKGGGSFHEVETLNVYAYGLSFDYNQYGLSSAVLILFFMIIIGSMWLLTMRKKAVSK